MLEAKANFCQRPNLNLEKEQTKSPEEARNIFRHCFIDMEDYRFSFYADQNQQTIIYFTTVSGMTTKIDEKAKQFILCRKGSKTPIIKIEANLDTLKKLEKFCEIYSNEALQWSPLVYVASEKVKESHTSTSGRKYDIAGSMALAIIISMFAQGQDLIKSYLEYGILPLNLGIPPPPSTIIYAVSYLTALTVLMMTFEKLAFKKAISETMTKFFEGFVIFLGLCFPVYHTLRHDSSPVLGILYSGWNLMMLMKMFSYMHLMHEVREILPSIPKSGQKNGNSSKTPLNTQISKENLEVVQKNLGDPSKLVNPRDILYFYFAPTLVYQLWYPRAKNIRWGRIIGLFVHLISCWTIFVFWTNQMLLPALHKAAEAFQSGTFAERTYKFTSFANAMIPMMLVFSYSFFHPLINIIAEFTRFGDRDFYRDWWNTKQLRNFWNKWNLPVHNWFQRHIYFPLLKRGHSKRAAFAAVFILSGVLHDYMASVPCKMISFYCTLLLGTQAIVIGLELKFRKFFERYYIGNLFMWGGFWYTSVPFVILMYYMQLIKIHPDKEYTEVK